MKKLEIEYQKREVTWCLDREGPRICLRAVIANNQIESLQITSADFILDLDGSESKNFLNMLWQLIETGFIDIQRREVIEKPIEQPEATIQEITEAKLDLVEEKPEVVSATEEQIEPEEDLISKIPDPSEILQILKQSDKIELTDHPSYDLEDLEKPSFTPDSQKSELFKHETDVASFFQETQIKSPLEKLLEEESLEARSEAETIDQVPLSQKSDEADLEEHEELPSQQAKIFHPEDLKSDSFISNFDIQSRADLAKELELELEPDIEPEVEIEPEDKSIPQSDMIEKEIPEDVPIRISKPDLTPEERRAAIEKERAERRRRLWELTRGF